MVVRPSEPLRRSITGQFSSQSQKLPASSSPNLPDMPTDSDIRQALSQVRYPGFSRDIISFGLVKNIVIEGGDVTVAHFLDPAGNLVGIAGPST